MACLLYLTADGSKMFIHGGGKQRAVGSMREAKFIWYDHSNGAANSVKTGKTSCTRCAKKSSTRALTVGLGCTLGNPHIYQCFGPSMR